MKAVVSFQVILRLQIDWQELFVCVPILVHIWKQENENTYMNSLILLNMQVLKRKLMNYPIPLVGAYHDLKSKVQDSCRGIKDPIYHPFSFSFGLYDQLSSSGTLTTWNLGRLSLWCHKRITYITSRGVSDLVLHKIKLTQIEGN